MVWSSFIVAPPNWNNVVAIRVGMGIRGAKGFAQVQGLILYLLGADFVGSFAEDGLEFVSPDDGRLRRAFSATFMLRNTVR